MADRSDKIIIGDLRAPVLTEDQKEFLAAAEREPVELTEAAVTAAARARARLDDFGPDDFRERVRLILAEADADPNATAFVRQTFFNRMAGVLANRLQVIDLLKRHPEIHEVKVERPIIVAGLPRSGTTHLLNLIGADSRLNALSYWESVQPIPYAWEETRPHGVDPRYARSQAGWARLQRVNPMMAPYHPMDPDHIHEDIELQMPDVASYQWEWMFRMPRWRDYYLSHDQTPHYAFSKTMLKILQWRRGDHRRWVLKAPQHFEQLVPIMNVFPDALVVFTHRDPAASLQSIVTQLAYVIRTREKTVDPDWHLDYWIDRVERLLRAYVRDVGKVPAGQRFDVVFDEFMADDIAMVERIYASAGLPLTDAARREFSDFMARHPRGKYGAIDHDLQRDFGISPARLRERFAFYLERLPLAAEAR